MISTQFCCVHCGTVNKEWNVLCSSCQRPLMTTAPQAQTDATTEDISLGDALRHATGGMPWLRNNLQGASHPLVKQDRHYQKK